MNVLAQFVNSGGIDIKSICYSLIVVIACMVLIGILLQIDFIKKNIAWVPQFVWALLGLLCVVVLALWVLSHF